MPAKIIVLEGLDCSFKETNTKTLKQFLIEKGKNAKLVSFPCYECNSSFFIKNYLKGEYGSPMEVDPYTASTFYALDRYHHKKTIMELYEEADYLIFDRYVDSNIIYQGIKTVKEFELVEYINWLYNLEYNRFGLPKPDITLFLKPDINYIISKIKEKNADDIHEKDINFQKAVYNFCDGLMKHKLVNWEEIRCSDGENPYTREEIFSSIVNELELANLL